MRSLLSCGLVAFTLILTTACAGQLTTEQAAPLAPAAFQADGPVSNATPLSPLPTSLPPTPAQRATTTPPQTTDPASSPTATSDPPTAIPPSATPVPTATPTPEPVCNEPGRIETGFFDSTVAGSPFSYRVYLPPCYGQDARTYPALYLFGGNIHNDAIWDVLGMDEAAEAGISAGTLEPLILVMPDNGYVANQTSGGPLSYEGLVLNELIPFIERTYCVVPDAAGRALGGLSRGGYWSLEIAFRQAHLFRSVGGHSPALIDGFAGPDKDPVATAATNDLGNLRIYVDIGANDYLLPRARPLHEALEARGIPHVWLVNEGTHEDAYWQSQLTNYLAWYNEGWDAVPDIPCQFPDR